MSKEGRKNFVVFLGMVALIGACVVFPRMAYFAEIAGREMRFLWWLVLIVAGGLWLMSATGKKDD